MRFRFVCPRLFLVCLLPLFAACGDDDGTGVARLTTEQVGGVYQVCALTFTPAGNFPEAVNILTRLEPQDTRLELSPAERRFNLLYRTTAGGLTQTAQGSYELGASTVDLIFNRSDALSALLLPSGERLTLDFQSSPKLLTVPAAARSYSVAKTDYEKLTGRTYPNLSNQISGSLSGRFSSTGC